METYYILLVALLLPSIYTEAAECEIGWTAYKDKLCIRAYTTELVTYDEASDICASQGSTGSLMMVKTFDLQNILENLTSEISDNLWLGGRYDNVTAELRWLDGEPLSYRNWADGYPRNSIYTDTCIFLLPPNAKAKDAKWKDAACQTRNFFICQKMLVWTFQDAVNEIIGLRENLDAANKHISRLEENLDAANEQIIPVGTIYVEYNGQSSPDILWPALSWQDVTSTYAGSFFRALGGDSEEWGVSQPSCAPRIAQIDYSEAGMDWEASHENPIPETGWSKYVWVGSWFREGGQSYERLKFYITECEVRPRNIAIRIWKRTA